MARHSAPRRRRNRDTTTDAPARDDIIDVPSASIAATLETFPGLPDGARLVNPDGTSHAIGIAYQGPDLPDHHLYQARVPAAARLVNGMVALIGRDTVLGVVVRDETRYRSIGQLG